MGGVWWCMREDGCTGEHERTGERGEGMRGVHVVWMQLCSLKASLWLVVCESVWALRDVLLKASKRIEGGEKMVNNGRNACTDVSFRNTEMASCTVMERDVYS